MMSPRQAAFRAMYRAQIAPAYHGLIHVALIYLIGGSAFYNQGCNSSGQFCRWGDYTATAPDLTVATRPSVWFSGQYANSSGNWGTAIGAARYLSPTDQ